ncbi:DUF3809 domain-containing protein [Deinococcus maricopensis]|uniref:DUF3809 domain-containing protein n=1 Tax=Deinococcus maricopensis (strain DSM 21211 / LMG 22137 / NRRL B-23946 / LB-34) TaxID=709986 RepID=E8U3M6_DEIML|nr:DUF3809 domain-containing protein [Deinococcus maricopensis]ADV68650.1 hypothetical protein Deima_3021 [Deinococcus maricopensis DSM 21211]
MIFEATQTFELPYPGERAAALAFLRDPARALARVRFLEGLHVHGDRVRATLRAPIPVLGEVTLPFESVLQVTADGATLTPQPISGERAWVEVAGQGHARGDAEHVMLMYAFQFRAHLSAPAAEHWGGAAFEKMARETARRTLERVAAAFPDAVRAAMP